MKRRILITGMGTGGSNNLYRDITKSNLDLDQYEFVGSNCKAEYLACSPLDENYLLPVATDADYIKALNRVMQENHIDLVIPNSDREVAIIAQYLLLSGEPVFLPHAFVVNSCQDKWKCFQVLRKAGVNVPDTCDDIDVVFRKGNIVMRGVWVRPKRGSGSRAATRVLARHQAYQWVSLWQSLRAYDFSDFIFSEYLPGRDYCVATLWNRGKLVLAKMCERLEYVGGDNSLSGTSSSPTIARTLRDDAALETCFKAVRAISINPYGMYNFDMKGREDGTMCITECNIGRFCMITPIFDLTGKYNMAEMYIRCAFGEKLTIDDPIDIEEDMYLLRGVDVEPKIVPGRFIETQRTTV